MIVIEMNPRVSRSSALASKATGFPIAKIAAKLAVGYRLHELPNDITRETMACFEPTIDYVVTKIPRFAFEKFPEADSRADDADEERRRDDGHRPDVQGVVSKGAARAGSRQLRLRLRRQRPLGHAAAAVDRRDPRQARHAECRARLVYPLRDEGRHVGRGNPRADANRSLVSRRDRADRRGGKRTASVRRAGRMPATNCCGGPSSSAFPTGNWRRSGTARKWTSAHARKGRGIVATFKSVDTCAAEFEAYTPYYYSTYEDEDETPPKPPGGRRIMILGGGPNRIGQGIEFDYCCCHASFALRELGIESIMVNTNPETVSTDYDTSDLLFFEPLTTEDVLNICDRVQPDGVIVQFGGQTPLNLSRALATAGVPIIGTSVDTIEDAEDREKFQRLLQRLGLRQPANGIARTMAEARAEAAKIGYPDLVRPSFVLGGRAMEICYDQSQLERFVAEAFVVAQGQPVLIDRFLEDAIEVDVDAICDGEQVLVAGIMEHIEEAGVHSRRFGLRHSALQPGRADSGRDSRGDRAPWPGNCESSG